MITTKDLGSRIERETVEPKLLEYLLQCLSVAVKRGDCVAVLGNHYNNLSTTKKL